MVARKMLSVRSSKHCQLLSWLSSSFSYETSSQKADTMQLTYSAELRQKLQHSKLANLLGEQAFGDFDFSMFKRRSATAQYHSSVNILT